MDDKVISWLLEKNNPSVRYFSLRYLLNKNQNDVEVIDAFESIMKTGDVVKILNKQNEDGSWDDPIRFYRSKYKGTVWTLLMLAELGADPNDERVKKACEFILNNAQEPIEGGFSADDHTETKIGSFKYVLPCLTGNMVYALIKLGYLEDPRIQKAIKWILTYQTTDDGDGMPDNAYLKSRPTCFGKHSCHLGVVKSLKALIAIPKDLRTTEITQKLSALSEYFSIHHLYKKSHHLDEVSKPSLTKLGFPLMYQTDILELLGLFQELDIKDERLNDALDILKSRQLMDGTFKLQNTYNGRTIINIEKKGNPSKWITLKSMIVLNWIK